MIGPQLRTPVASSTWSLGGFLDAGALGPMVGSGLPDEFLDRDWLPAARALAGADKPLIATAIGCQVPVPNQMNTMWWPPVAPEVVAA